MKRLSPTQEPEAQLAEVLLQLPNLQHVTITRLYMQTPSLVAFSTLRSLRGFKWSACCSPATLDTFRQLPALTQLHIHSWDSPATCASVLGQISNLQSLTLGGRLNLPNAYLGTALAGMSGLTELQLAACMPNMQLTGQTLPRLPQLARLDVERCEAWTDAGLVAIAANLPAIRHLTLGSQVRQLESPGLARVACLMH